MMFFEEERVLVNESGCKKLQHKIIKSQIFNQTFDTPRLKNFMQKTDTMKLQQGKKRTVSTAGNINTT